MASGSHERSNYDGIMATPLAINFCTRNQLKENIQKLLIINK